MANSIPAKTHSCTITLNPNFGLVRLKTNRKIPKVL